MKLSTRPRASTLNCTMVLKSCAAQDTTVASSSDILGLVGESEVYSTSCSALLSGANPKQRCCPVSTKLRAKMKHD